MNITDILIFSEIGKTSWSSKASEELLTKLIWKLNKEDKKLSILYSQFFIF